MVDKEQNEIEATEEHIDENIEAVAKNIEVTGENEEIAMLVSSEVEDVSFLPEADESILFESEQAPENIEAVEGSELSQFESAQIEEIEFIEDERLESIIESILFASDRPVGLAAIKAIFKGTNISTERIRRCVNSLMVEYAGARRGVTLEEAPGGYQLRTKLDNMSFLSRSLKARPFRLSGPALEVLAICAYKQPVVKHEIDEIRGVESGHLLRALMERNLVSFAGKSDLPGKPMQYQTTRKFLEIFGLRNLKELPTLSQIDELLPEGIGDEEENKPKLADITEALSEQIGQAYTDGEEELLKITDKLQEIQTSSEFFEQEKLRQKQARDAEKAQNIRDALAVGEAVSNRDKNWLERYDLALAGGDTTNVDHQDQEATATEMREIDQAIAQFEADADIEAASDDSLDHEEWLEANDIADIDGDDQAGL